MNRTSARLAAHGFRRQVQSLSHADALADAAETIVRRAWRDILAALRSAHGPHDVYKVAGQIRRILTPVGQQVIALVGPRLERFAVKAHADTAETLADHLPRPMLAVAAVTEDDSTFAQPGLVTITPDRATAFQLPGNFADLSATAQRDVFQSLLFPPPEADAVRRLVYAGDWWKRLEIQTKIAAPDEITPIVWRSISSGQSIKQLANDLLPVVDGVRSTARRIARDETMRVSHATQRAAWGQIDELIVGYRVNAVLDNRTRPEHKKRDGTIYYKEPEAGQKGLDEMPNPPYESPRDNSKLAWNCRCWLDPVTVDPDSIAPTDDAVPAGTLDPDAVSDWFDVAPQADRRVAVGAARYNAVKDALGRKPGWRDFTDESGELLDTEVLLGRLGALS